MHGAHWQTEVVAPTTAATVTVRVSRQDDGLLLELTTRAETAIEVQEVILTPRQRLEP